MREPALPFTLRRGWQPGDLGWVIGAHGTYYGREWGFGAAFEGKVAEAMGAWIQRYDPARDLLLMAQDGKGPLGAISLDGSGAEATREGARLRFFIMADRARGLGLGRVLLGETMAFIRAAGFPRAYLTTFRGLDAARALYEAHGWVLTSEVRDESWGTPLHEQRFDWQA
jgi:GNAT superfamily N-acetyltransferase